MKLTVLQVLPELESGGVERGTVEIAEALVKQGHNALVISGGGSMVKQLDTAGAKHYSMPVGKKSIFSLRHCLALRKFIKTQKIHIIDVRSRFPAWLVWLTLKMIRHRNRPILITSVHGAYSVSLYSAIMMKGDHIVAVSEYIRDYILKNYPFVDKNKITVIPRGVSFKDYYPDYKPNSKWLKTWNEKNPTLQGKLIITLVGRISKIKGQDDFILIIKQLIDAGLNVHGLLVGGTHKKKEYLMNNLLSMIERHKIKDHITLLGNRNDAKEIISVSDIILSLTKKPEAFGRTIIEALALGKPVLAYDHGGAREILIERFPQGLIKLGDKKKFCSRIESIIMKSEKPISSKQYSLEWMLNRNLSFYKNLIRNQ